MGILILLSVEDRNVRIETGKTMQAYITDSKSGQLLDKYGMDYFVEDKFAEGLVSVQDALISEIRDVVPANWNSKTDIVEQEKEAVETYFVQLVELFRMVIAFDLLLCI